jgi:hypothetical protein
MLKTLHDLALDMDKLAVTLKLEGNRCAIESALIVHHNLTEITPVDTSTALSNWDVFIGSYEKTPHEPYFMGKRGSTKLKSMRFANKEAALILSEKKPGESIFIVNAVDYIEKLNGGSSTQAPAGFVERAIMLGQKYVKNFKIDLGKK